MTQNKCTSCGFDNAYIGLNEVKCINEDCKHYCVSWRKEKIIVTEEDNFTFDDQQLDLFLDNYFPPFSGD